MAVLLFDARGYRRPRYLLLSSICASRRLCHLGSLAECDDCDYENSDKPGERVSGFSKPHRRYEDGEERLQELRLADFRNAAEREAAIPGNEAEELADHGY